MVEKNLFQIYEDAGRTGITVALAKLTVDELKKLCQKYALDPTGSYRNYQHSGELAKFIAYRVKCMMEKGSVFK
ncbi:MAG: SAP domain-containing protein [Syntrophomonadaceae bacterium]|nr:SAP domain-containing protein [Syntrophomonadaceae bacterium]MDD3897960.1 SAP domain-containing protein [Syntrophomonadaceae bacterium]MDD4549429.1 SAP domain-containing protein [Syntrophomonadaceae bacterium]